MQSLYRVYTDTARAIDVTLIVYASTHGKQPYWYYNDDQYYQSMLSLYEAAMDKADEVA
jgi:hypothetical protein